MDTPDERILKGDPDEEKVRKVQSAYREAKKHQRNWRVEALEAYDFRDGRQWSEEDQQTLQSEGRPVVTFNRMSPYFDAVGGTEINNRQEIKYLPRTLDDQRQNEILTAAVKWIRYRTNAGYEESDSFQDVLVTGMGWIETRMEYDEDPDGKVVMERINPLEMRWDPQSRKRNLADANWIQREKWLSEDEIKGRWPDVELGVTSSPWGDEAEDKVEPHNANLAFLYRETSTDTFDAKSGKYRVVQHLYWEYSPAYRVQDPMSGKMLTLSEEKYKLAKTQIPDLKAAKIRVKTYKYIFVVGDQIAEEGDLKCGFNIKCITGKRDQNTGLWYGLTRVMKDPQRWANKFLAQIMHIVNTNAKGGLMAEVGAFVDPKKAEEDWSDPASVTLLKNGGLAKVKEKQQSQYPQGLDKLLQFAISSIPDATGINLEFMGMQDRAQANVLEQTRKKSAFVILASFFDSLRMYREEQGKLLAHFVKEYMNDGRIIRITTEQGEQAIPLRLTEDTLTYDVVVDQAPDSPNLKEEVWNDMKELLPQFIKAGMPIPPSIFKYSPLPLGAAQEFQNSMQGKLPPQAMQQMQAMQQQLQQLTQENQKLKQQAQIKLIQDNTKKELGKEKNAIEAAKLQHAAMSHQADATREAEMMRAQEEIDARTQMREMQAEFLRVQAEHAKEMERMRKEHEHAMEIQAREITAKILEGERNAAREEARAAKETKRDEKTVVKQVAQLSKDSETMLKDISGLVQAIATLAESVKAMADENAKEDDPKRYDIKRDEAGRVQSITPVH